MNIIPVLAILYLASASVIEAAVQTLYRFYKDIRLLLSKVNHRAVTTYGIRSEWRVVARWLSLVLSLVLVKLIGITFIAYIMKDILQMEPSPYLESLDVLLTGLVISRGSNFVHDFLQKQKDNIA